MKEYRVKAYGNYERRLKQKEIIIPAKDEEDAWIRAWKAFPEYDEISVTEYEEQPDFCRFDKDCPCGYPIEDCENCPAHPNSNDPYWKMTEAVIGNG